MIFSSMLSHFLGFLIKIHNSQLKYGTEKYFQGKLASFIKQKHIPQTLSHLKF